MLQARFSSMSSERNSTRGFFQNPLFISAILGSGLLAGLLGVGGGILIVPSLVLFGGMSQRKAHGTSLAAIVLLSATGFLGYVLEDSVNYAASLVLIGGAVLGVRAGTMLLNKIPVRQLKLAFGILACLVAARFFFGIEGGDSDFKWSVAAGLGLWGIGILAGLVSGVLGVGGGVVIVPSLIFTFDFMGIDARGTSLLVILVTALVGTARNHIHKNLDLKLGIQVGLIGVTVSFAAALGSTRVSEDILSLFFGCLMAVVALRMFWEFWRWIPEFLDDSGD